MSKTYRNGAAGPIAQGTQFSFNPREGFKNTLPFKGSVDACLAYAASLSAIGIAYSFKQDGPSAEVVIEGQGSVSGTTETPIHSWQLLGNQAEKSIWEHPKALALNAVDPLAIATVKSWVKDYEASSIASPFDMHELGGHVADDYYRLFQLAIKEADHYAIGQYVLRHTQTVSSWYTADILDENPLTIYTTQQLLDECATFGRAPFGLPKRMINKINAIDTQLEPDVQTDYLWGWLKYPSTEQTVADFKVEITTEYLLEQWSTFSYEPL